MKFIFFLVRNDFFQCISYDMDLKKSFLRRKKIFSYTNFLFTNKSNTPYFQRTIIRKGIYPPRITQLYFFISHLKDKI